MDVESFEETSWDAAPEILDILQKDLENNIIASINPKNIKAHGVLRAVNSVRDKMGPDEEFVLLTLGGKVDPDATFMVLEKIERFNVFFYSCNPDAERMINLLKNCKYINWKDNNDFGPVPERFLDAFWKLLKDFELSVSCSPVASVYFLEPVIGKTLTFECPPEVYMDQIKEEHAELINSVWPHRSKNSVKWVKRIICILGGVGIFTKESNELISWAMRSLLGGPGLLQTVESHKRKGYGNIAAKVMTKHYSDRNEYAVLYIMSNNIPSQELFKKLGFKKGCKAQFFTVKPM